MSLFEAACLSEEIFLILKYNKYNLKPHFCKIYSFIKWRGKACDFWNVVLCTFGRKIPMFGGCTVAGSSKNNDNSLPIYMFSQAERQ